MDCAVIILASCHMDKYSSFVLLLELPAPSHSLSLHMERLYRFSLEEKRLIMSFGEWLLFKHGAGSYLNLHLVAVQICEYQKSVFIIE